MGLIKHLIIAVILTGFSSSSNAQFLGVGASFDYTNNGINVFYSDYFGKKDRWSFDAGLRVTVNTYSLHKNKQSYLYYQTGYANTFWEHFALNINGTRKLVTYKKIRLDLMTNLRIAYQSMLMKIHDKDYLADTIVKTNEVYWKPAPIIELTLGLKIQVEVAPKISIYAMSGIGICYLWYHFDEGWNRTANEKVTRPLFSNERTRERGDIEYVGLDGGPIISVGLKYKLK